jgi:lysophospholipase L1-like esterase
MSSRSRSRAASAALLLVALTLALGVSEGVPRKLERPELRGPLAWKTSLDWSEGINELGFRAKRPARTGRTERILLLGDSHIEGYHTKLRDTFGAKLQQYLRHRGWPVEVLALGAGGWGTDQQLIALQLYADELEPDQVLVYYTHQNDIWNSLFPTHMGTPKPTYRLADDGQLVPPDPALWRPARPDPNARAVHGILPAVRRLLGGGHASDSEWEATLPARVAAPAAGPDLPVLAEVYEDTFGLALWDGEDMESERSHFAHLKHPPTARLQYALELQQALFAELKRECDARGIPLRVFRAQALAAIWEGEYAHLGRSYTLSFRAASERLRTLFAAIDVPLLEIDDLTLAHTWLPRDAHLNPAGNRFVAERVGDWLLAERELQ